MPSAPLAPTTASRLPLLNSCAAPNIPIGVLSSRTEVRIISESNDQTPGAVCAAVAVHTASRCCAASAILYRRMEGNIMSHIHQLLKQAHLMLLAMLVPCESKHLLRRQGKADDHIHSFRSYHNYWPIIQRFVRAYAAAFPSSKSIKYGRSYVPVWLQQQAQRGCVLYLRRPDLHHCPL